MKVIHSCNLEWKKHIEKNRFLLLYMGIKERELFEHAYFSKVRLSLKKHGGLIIYFSNAETKNIYSLHRRNWSSWGAIIDESGEDMKIAGNTSDLFLNQLLSSFNWESYGEQGN